MPWCPTCRQEYRAGIASCADCGAALVADLAAHEAAARTAAATRTLRIVAPAGTLEALKGGLAGRKIPFEADPEGGGLIVPAAAGELIEATLAPVAEFERALPTF